VDADEIHVTADHRDEPDLDALLTALLRMIERREPPTKDQDEEAA
jgi:hypothetical protein